MSTTKNCYNCRISLADYTPLYSCCRQERSFCSRCRPHHCPNCGRSAWKELKDTRCLVCKKKLPPNDALKEQICGQHYCHRCIAQAFLPFFLSRDPPIIIELRCGHFKDREEVESFLANCCINCGWAFKPSSDYQLQNGMKLCQFCFNHDEKKEFDDFLQQCMGCGTPLKFRESSKSNEFFMCHRCSQNQTLIEQSLIQSRKTETKPNSLITEHISSKHRPHNSHIEEEEPSEDLSIVSRFSAFDLEEETVKKGKLASMRTLSKNSVEMRVENFKLPQIVRQPSESLVRCCLCRSLLDLSATLPNTTHSNTRICKMCFAQTFDKSYISFTRYNNYLQSDTRTTSLPKHTPTNTNPMKLSMLPPESVVGRQTQRLSTLLKHSVPAKVERREAWEEVQAQNLCEVCRVRPWRVMKVNKKKMCEQCGNSTHS